MEAAISEATSVPDREQEVSGREMTFVKVNYRRAVVGFCERIVENNYIGGISTADGNVVEGLVFHF